MAWYTSKNPSAISALILTQAYAITQVYVFFSILIFAIGVYGSVKRQSYIIVSTFGLILLGYAIFAIVDRRRNKKREESTWVDSSSSGFFQTKSSLTSIWLPCVTVSSGHTFLTSSITSLINNILMLALAFLVTFTEIVQPNALQCLPADHDIHSVGLQIIFLSDLSVDQVSSVTTCIFRL